MVAQIKLSYYFLCIYYLNEKVFSIDVIVDDVYFVWSKIVTGGVGGARPTFDCYKISRIYHVYGKCTIQ